MTKLSLYLIIHGRVQGVGYRAWMASRARQYGLNGWVRNRRDGTVEAVVMGETLKVEQLVAECHEGPLSARVTSIDSKPCDGETATSFTSRETI
ncbi:MAG: acylphosphatase [Rickettsiales bacterium]